jgi:hypothetical protein
MTTKKELIEGWTKELRQAEAELEALEKEHQQFQEEDKVCDALQVQIDKLDKFRTDLLNKQYEGNFETHDNWYKSKLPERFAPIEEKFGHSVIRDALNELKDQKYKEILDSTEMKETDRKIDELNKQFHNTMSKEHRLIEEKVGNSWSGLLDRIKRLKDLLTKVEDRGWFISHCKSLSRYKEVDAENKKKEQELQACVEEIRKVTK